MPAACQNGISVGVAILAAGASSRMGRPKLLLPWDGTTILGHLLAQWVQAGARQIAIVLAEGNPSLRAELDRLGVSEASRVFNPRPEEEMFSSIRCAAGWSGWSADLTHWVVTLGDQPLVRPETLRALLELGAASPDRICQPAHLGRARHPVLFPGSIFAQLQDASEEHLKQFLANRPEFRAYCELDDPGLDFDLDLPEDYERALEMRPPATGTKS